MPGGPCVVTHLPGYVSVCAVRLNLRPGGDAVYAAPPRSIRFFHRWRSFVVWCDHVAGLGEHRLDGTHGKASGRGPQALICSLADRSHYYLIESRVKSH